MKRFQSALAIVIALLLALSAMPVFALQESIGKTMSERDSCEGSTREAPDTGTRTQSHYQNFSSNYVLTGNGASDMVAVALAQEGMSGSQLGYTEDWCADFVGDCAILAHQSAAVPLYGGVPGLRTRLINAGGIYVSVATAQPGDLCIIDWNGNGNNNHIEIVYSANGSSISTIGGNTGSGTISTRTVKKHNPLSNSVITCIIRPNYSYNPISIPAAPQNIRIDKSLYSTTEYIHLAWDASAGATDYYVYLWNDDIGVELYGIDNGTNLSFTQAPLGVGNYTFIVRAGNSAGYSNSDAYVRFKVYDRIPDSPKNLRTSNGSTLFSFTESITFLWDASELATDYYVYLWNDDIGVELYGIDNGTNLSYTQAPLSPGNYTFIVRAGNSIEYSNSDAYYRFKVYDRAPDSPKNLRTSTGSMLFNTAESITFLWDASELATDYYVYLWDDDIGVQLYAIDNGTNLSYTQAPLSPGNYTFIVRAGNSIEYSNSDAYYRFKVCEAENLGYDFYAFIEHQSTGLLMTNQSDNIAGEAASGSNRQIWHFIRQSNGSYAIISAYDDSCMDVLGYSLDNGANVYSYSGGYLGQPNQQFYIYQAYGAYYFIPVHANGTMTFDMDSYTCNLQIWSIGAGWDTQKFNINKIAYLDNSLPCNIGEDFYAFIEHQSTGLLMTNQSDNIAGEAASGSNTQIWHFIRQSNGSYAIISSYDNSCMDVLGYSLDNGANVYSYSGGYLGQPNQQFYIYQAYGAYYFIPAHANGSKALDMSLSTHNLEIWGVGADWEPQKFNIQKTTYPIVDVNSVNFTIGEVSAAPGSDVSVDFCIDGEYEASALTVYISYDADKLTLNSINQGQVWNDMLNLNANIMSYTSVAGSIRFIAIVPTAYFSTSGTIFTMNFHVKENVTIGTDIPLGIDIREFFVSPIGGTEAQIPYAVTNGVIHVNCLPGDVNGDGVVNSMDIIIIMRYALGINNLNASQLIAADYNGDGQVNASDALMMMRISLGIA